MPAVRFRATPNLGSIPYWRRFSWHSQKVIQMSTRTPIRHGEVLLLPVYSAPEGGVVEKITKCIVGHSESGHHHILEANAEFEQIITEDGNMFVDLAEETPLRHLKDEQQHRELQVPAGAYKVVH